MVKGHGAHRSDPIASLSRRRLVSSSSTPTHFNSSTRTTYSPFRWPVVHRRPPKNRCARRSWLKRHRRHPFTMSSTLRSSSSPIRSAPHSSLSSLSCRTSPTSSTTTMRPSPSERHQFLPSPPPRCQPAPPVSPRSCLHAWRVPLAPLILISRTLPWAYLRLDADSRATACDSRRHSDRAPRARRASNVPRSVGRFSAWAKALSQANSGWASVQGAHYCCEEYSNPFNFF
jgi:hypothetical protein